MSIEAHLSELVRKHGELERRIEEVALHPSADTLEVTELKRRKLKLKDEIERTRQATRH